MHGINSESAEFDPGVIRRIGDDRTAELFSMFCAKAISMIGRRFHDAIRIRRVTVELHRKTPADRVVKFKHEDDAERAVLRSRPARFAIDNAEALRTAEPSMPLSFVE